MRGSGVGRFLAIALACCAARVTADPLGDEPASPGLTAVVGCSSSLPVMQAALSQTTFPGVQAVIGDLDLGAAVAVSLPENITGFDPLPLFCSAFAFDTATGTSELVPAWHAAGVTSDSSGIAGTESACSAVAASNCSPARRTGQRAGVSSMPLMCAQPCLSGLAAPSSPKPQSSKTLRKPIKPRRIWPSAQAGSWLACEKKTKAFLPQTTTPSG